MDTLVQSKASIKTPAYAAQTAKTPRSAASARRGRCSISARRRASLSDVEVIRIDEINEAYERMLKNDVRYRFVIDIASIKDKDAA